VRTNNVEAVTRYVRSKKDCNVYVGVFPPLTVAASEGLLEMVELLIAGFFHMLRLFATTALTLFAIPQEKQM
jgi:hypothetical protein